MRWLVKPHQPPSNEPAPKSTRQAATRTPSRNIQGEHERANDQASHISAVSSWNGDPRASSSGSIGRSTIAASSRLRSFSTPTGWKWIAVDWKTQRRPRGKVKKRTVLAPVDAAAWRQRRLVFRQDTLADIAAEFNRYNSIVKIRVIGAAASHQHYSGTFDADAQEDLVHALAGDNALIVERRANEIVIRAR